MKEGVIDHEEIHSKGNITCLAWLAILLGSNSTLGIVCEDLICLAVDELYPSFASAEVNGFSEDAAIQVSNASLSKPGCMAAAKGHIV
jgi:hypothetical protein